MALMEACWKVEQCVLCGSLTENISTCLPDFRSFLYGLVCSSNAFNHYALHNSIQIDMSSTQHNPLQELCTSPTSMHFSHQCGSWSTAALLSRHKDSETAVMRVSTDSTCIPSLVPCCEETKGNHNYQRLDCIQDVQEFPSPSSTADTGYHDSDEVSHYLKEDDATLQQVWLFSIEDRTTHHHATQQHNMHH